MQEMDERRRRDLRLLAGHPQPVVGGDRTVRLGNGLGEALDEIDRLRQENRALRRLRASPQRERVIDYGTEERHDRPRPFAHQHYHAHYGAQKPEGAVPEHTGDFSHPHRHGRDADHHR